MQWRIAVQCGLGGGESLCVIVGVPFILCDCEFI